MSHHLNGITTRTRDVRPEQVPAVVRYGVVTGLGLLISLAMLAVSHGLILTDPVVLFFAVVLALPAVVTLVAPAAGVAMVLIAALISWDIPALIPQLAALGSESTFAIALLAAWGGMLARVYFDREELTQTPLFKLIVLCGIWTLISFAWNFWQGPTDRSTLIDGLKGLASTALFFLLVANAVRTEKALRVVLYTIVVASIPVSVAGYLQYGWRYMGLDYSGIHPAIQKLAEHITFSYRIAGTLSETTILSMYYLVVVVLAVALFCVERSRRLRVLLLATLAFDLWPFLVDYTKSTLIIALFALLALAWMRKSWRLAAISTIATGASYMLLTLNPVFKTMATHVVEYGMDKDTGDIAQRYQFMGNCLASIPSHPVFGLGPGGSVVVTGVNCHDVPLELATNLGIVGLALFGWLIYRVYRLSWGVPLRQSQTLFGTLAQANMALLLAFGVLAVIWSLTSFTLPWLWCIVALVVGGGSFLNRSAASVEDGPAQPSKDELSLAGEKSR